MQFTHKLSRIQNESLFLSWLIDGGLLGDVDAVQELTDILVLAEASLIK